MCVWSRRSSGWICIEFCDQYARKIIWKKKNQPCRTKLLTEATAATSKTKQTHQSKLDNQHIKQKPKKTPIQCVHRFLKDGGSEVDGSMCERERETERQRKKKQNANSANKENYGDFVLIFRNSDLNMNAIAMCVCVCVCGCNFSCCRLLFCLCCCCVFFFFIIIRFFVIVSYLITGCTAALFVTGFIVF